MAVMGRARNLSLLANRGTEMCGCEGVYPRSDSALYPRRSPYLANGGWRHLGMVGRISRYSDLVRGLGLGRHGDCAL